MPFDSAIAALRLDLSDYPRVTPTEDELEVAEILEATQEIHVRADGRCLHCARPWPCSAWEVADRLALEFLIRGVNRYSRWSA